MTSYINQLDAFVASRPGFDPANYSDAASYAADRRVALRAMDDYYMLRNAVQYVVTDDALEGAARGSRITFGPDGVEYCTGQYYPTEYRAAACRVLASVWWREQAVRSAPGEGADAIRKHARAVFGRAIARRWFS
jgi:hypothetical protein